MPLHTKRQVDLCLLQSISNNILNAFDLLRVLWKLKFLFFFPECSYIRAWIQKTTRYLRGGNVMFLQKPTSKWIEWGHIIIFLFFPTTPPFFFFKLLFWVCFHFLLFDFVRANQITELRRFPNTQKCLLFNGKKAFIIFLKTKVRWKFDDKIEM